MNDKAFQKNREQRASLVKKILDIDKLITRFVDAKSEQCKKLSVLTGHTSISGSLKAEEHSKRMEEQKRQKEERLEHRKNEIETNKMLAQLRKHDSSSVNQKGTADKSHELRAKLLMIRNEYLDFAGDMSRINSMRIMAARFAEQLTELFEDSTQ